MRCPDCKSRDSLRVVKTVHTASSVRRRRKCSKCGSVFVTFEVDERDLTVRKINELKSKTRDKRAPAGY